MSSRFQPGRMMIVGLRAEDVSTTVRFYRDVMGLHLMPHHGPRPAFDVGDGTYLVVVEGQPAPDQDAESSPFPLITFTVEDLDQAVAHLGDHDVELPWGVEQGEGSRWVIFRDPAGNLVEFVQFSRPIHP
jgi:catechol 2,3-dioxygenase-like lactoylglutathione lyase family enzyme